MSRKIVALLLVALVAATQEEPKVTKAPPPDCYQYTSCSMCTNAPSGECGWLATDNMCKHGTPNGPDNLTVSSELWNFYADDCCSSSVHCSDCVSAWGNCGWNVGRGACQSIWGPSRSDSSSSNNPNGFALIGVGGTCPSTCQAAVDCDSCIEMNNCGWSNGLEMCLAGGNAGPYITPSMRYYGSVAWSFTSCSSRNWQLRWSVTSYPLWCIVGGAAVVALFASIVAGRRRRRLLLEQRRRPAAPYAAAPQAQPTVATPLVDDTQGDYTGHLVYGQLLPTPYYGVAPDATISVGDVPTIAKPQ